MTEASSSSDAGEDNGFTLVELVVALMIIAGVLVALAYVLIGASAALGATRLRSVYTEIANHEVEALRSRKYDSVGVRTDDPNYAAQYPSGKYQGRDAVQVGAAVNPPAAVTQHASPPVVGAGPYKVERWITWTDVSGGSGRSFKRLDVRVTWTENGRTSRSIKLSSLMYPGGIGLAASANQAPTVSFTATPDPAVEDVAVVFAALATDPDGDTLTYQWHFGDGGSSTLPEATHTYVDPGTYVAKVIVRDPHGATAEYSKAVLVSRAGNGAPVASFTLTPDPTRTDIVNVNGSGSSDPDGDSLTYRWDWGDGTQTTGVNSGHRYLRVETYTVTLTVTDSSGASNSTTRSHTVSTVGCTVIEGSFKNPASASTANFIALDNSQKPKNTSFTFYARSTSACSSLAGRLPYIGDTFVVALGVTSTVDGISTWSGTGTFPTNGRFSVGASQTGEVWGPATTGAGHKFTFPFGAS